MAVKVKSDASLSLDLDNQWSYMKTRGDEEWRFLPSYLDLLLPRALEFFDKHGLRITFFIVGQDAAFDKNTNVLRRITSAGHEVGNHSFSHEPWLHLYTDEEIDAEIGLAEDAITAATGQRPRGFRGPGFSFSRATLEVLRRRGYRYDASTFPTFLGPLARAYYMFSAGLDREEREQRKALFGSFSEGLRPLRPYAWALQSGPLPEIPVTTMPLFKVPFHLSYVIYLSCYSPALARAYFRTSLRMCRWFSVEPSLLLHPLDFLGGDEIDALKFFPGMSITAKKKIELVDGLLTDYRRAFRIMPIGEHLTEIEKRGRLSHRPAPPWDASAAPEPAANPPRGAVHEKPRVSLDDAV